MKQILLNIKNFFFPKKFKTDKKNRIRVDKSAVSIIFKAVCIIFLVAYIASLCMMLYFAFVNSFKTENNFFFSPITFPSLMGIRDYMLVAQPNASPLEYGYEFAYQLADYNYTTSFGNYLDVFTKLNYRNVTVSYYTMFDNLHAVNVSSGNVNFMGLLGNTLYMAVVCTLAQTFVCYTTAYLAAKYKFKFSGFLYAYVIIVMSIPIVGSAPSMINILHKLNLYGRYIGMLFMRASFGGMYFLVFYAFFESLPDSYTEAAEIDGASQLDVFIRIIIPLGIKSIMTISLITMVANWNDYSMTLMYMPTIPTLSFTVYYMTNTNWFSHEMAFSTRKFTACIVLFLPMLLMFVLFKDQLMGNVSAGGLKG